MGSKGVVVSPQKAKVEDVHDGEPLNGGTASTFDEMTGGGDIDREEGRGWEWWTKEEVSLRKAREGEHDNHFWKSEVVGCIAIKSLVEVAVGSRVAGARKGLPLALVVLVGTHPTISYSSKGYLTKKLKGEAKTCS